MNAPARAGAAREERVSEEIRRPETMRRAPRVRLVLLVLGVAAGGGCAAMPHAAPKSAPMLVVHAQVLDGTGAAARSVAVRVRDGRIAEVGELSPQPGETVVDAGGAVLAPGFVDTHSHADRGLAAHPDALAAVSQGITTVVVGQDGDTPTIGDRRAPAHHALAAAFDALARRPVAVNVASYVGHNSVRDQVMGKDFKRHATAAEVEKMAALVGEGMADGALGLSTGLEYDPGIFSDPEEVLALARVAARSGGRYISHVRSEDRNFWAAIEELLRIGRETGMPVQVSHIKLAMRSLWGQSARLLARLDQARHDGVDVTADIYPYTYWQSTLTVVFPERNFTDRKAAEFALAEVSSPEGMLISTFAPEPALAGKTIAEIAHIRRSDPPATLMALIAEALDYESKHPDADEVESVIGTSMEEADVAALFAWPFTDLCTDGGLDGRHPRGFGSFPRALGRWVREQGVVSLPEAVRKMTSLAAHNVGLRDRGTIAPGMAADLVLFDPTTVLDHATTKEPHALAAGIRTVWVNGVAAYAAGRATGARPGTVLRRPAPLPAAVSGSAR
jgi:N-acyl-D-amino-acid deacylase